MPFLRVLEVVYDDALYKSTFIYSTLFAVDQYNSKKEYMKKRERQSRITKKQT